MRWNKECDAPLSLHEHAVDVRQIRRLCVEHLHGEEHQQHVETLVMHRVSRVAETNTLI